MYTGFSDVIQIWHLADRCDRSFARYRQQARGLLHPLLLLLILVAGACRSDQIGQPTTPDIRTLFWKVELNHRAVVLSVHHPYDTVQIRGVAKNAYGDVLATTDTLQFRPLVSTDSAIQLGSGGLLTARYPTFMPVQLEVSLVHDGVARYDTVSIMVRDEWPIRFLKSITFRPGPRDSSSRWAGFDTRFFYMSEFGFPQFVSAADSADFPIFVDELAVEYDVEKPEVVGDLYKTLGQTRVGESWIGAKTYAYGRVVADSFLFRRVEPTAKFVVVYKVYPNGGEPRLQFYPDELRIKKGNTVIFVNRIYTGAGTPPFGANVPKEVIFSASRLGYADSVDIVFDDPSVVGPAQSFGVLNNWRPEIVTVFGLGFRADTSMGNIPAFGHMWCFQFFNVTGDHTCGGLAEGINELDRGWRSRRFSVPGTVRYTSTRFPNASGTIIITE